MFFDDSGRLRSLPASWTDVDPTDVWTATAAGRACLRAEDLVLLAALIAEMKSRQPGKR
jgi:hypothetical protein